MRRALLAVLLGALLLAGCAAQPAPAAEYVPVADLTDIHGLAVDPTDGSHVYVATHHGLIRGRESAWLRVGTMQDDLMGFTMHPSNGSTFWASGHPQGGGNMGVRQSTDGGFTWTQLSLAGVDFHALTVSPADADVLWGAWAGSTYHSVDGGRTWATHPGAPPARSLTAHPTDASVLFATTQTGIQRSADAGRTWAAFADVPARALAIDPSDADVMYAGVATGVAKSTDAGRTWTTLGWRTTAPVAHLAIDPQATGTIWAATLAIAIHRSPDGGVTWVDVKPGRGS